MYPIRHLLCGLALLSLVGCTAGNGAVVMDPFTPDEVEVLVYAATATYLMDKKLTTETAQSATAYLGSLRAVLESEHLDTAALRKELVTNVPVQWQPLAEATWVILLKRIHLDALIQAGNYPEAKAYLSAALNGTMRALESKRAR